MLQSTCMPLLLVKYLFTYRWIQDVSYNLWDVKLFIIQYAEVQF